MITKLKPYPAYRDSGVGWIGTVPESWKVLSSRRFCRVFAGATPRRDEPSFWDGGTIPWLVSGDVNQRHIVSANQLITDAGFQASSTKWIRPGSIVVALAGQGRTKGMAAMVGLPATCNQSLGVLEPISSICYPEFLLFYLESRYRDIRGLVGDLRDGLNLEHLKALAVPLPSLSEQGAISRFLNHLDSRFERYVAAKERLISLLEDEKRAVVLRTLTRGIDHSVPLRSSGVDWVGEVPAHWDVRPLKWACRLQRGYDLPAEKRLPGDIPVISSGGIIGTHSEVGARGPGVVMGRYGSTGAVHFVDGDYWPHNTALFVTRFYGNEPLWAFYLLQVVPKAELAAKSAVPGVDRRDLHRISVPVPPVQEQRALLDELANQTRTLVNTIEAARRQVDLLRQYRTRLISDVVTGKLDVREAAARLAADSGAADPALDEHLEEVATG